jgi:hypothetical protein
VGSSVQSFVIRIWIEETAEEAGEVTWRGHITHTVNGERHFFMNLNELSTFIWPYLIEMSAKPPIRYRINLWLKNQRTKVRSK